MIYPSKRTLKKRREDTKAQLAYLGQHPWCEVCQSEGRGSKTGMDVHEIVFRSHQGKCEEPNMISLCRPDHQRAHFLKQPYLRREDLLQAK